MLAFDRISRVLGVTFLTLAIVVLLKPGSNLRRGHEGWKLSRSARQLVADSLSQGGREFRLIGSQAPRERLVVVTDYSCAFCAMFSDSMATLIKADSGRGVLLLFRQATAWSRAAALSAICASKQGHLESMDEYLFSRTDSVPEAEWEEVATTLKLPAPDEFVRCRKSNVALSELAADSTLLSLFGVRGTPAFISKGKGLHVGLLPNEALASWFDSRE